MAYNGPMNSLLPLPISPAEALTEIIVPALGLCSRRMDSAEAEVILLAIALQESGLAHRKLVGGPARGLWQFEIGGMRGVFTHPASAAMAAEIAKSRGIVNTPEAAYQAASEDDILAACMARLLLWTDAKPLPAIGAMNDAWGYYQRNWRPGKPHPERWAQNYRKAMACVAPEGRA